MFNKRSAFTLIELLIVVSIIMIITASGSLYFFGFLDSQKLNSNIELIQTDIKDLDLKVKNYEIFDYKLIFSSGSLGYIFYINNFDIPYNQEISFNFSTGTGKITTSSSESGLIRVLKIYKKHKLFLEKVLDSQTDYNGLFNEEKTYKIKGYIDGKELNEIGVKYFTENNVLKENDDYLVLSNIYKDKNKSSECKDKLKIINIGGKKEIYCGTNKINKAFFLFYQNSKEKIIEIN